MSLSGPPEIVGHSLDGGVYVITAQQNMELCQSLGVAPESGGWAHPVYFYIASQVGMGVSVAALCALCDFDVSAGPMIVSCDVTFFQPLLIGVEYQVRGGITGLTRKQSRKLGVIDVLDYALHLDLPDGARACTVNNSWVLPRGHGDAH